MIFNKGRGKEREREVKATLKSRRVLCLAGKYPKFKSSLPRRHQWISSGQYDGERIRRGRVKRGNRREGSGGNNLPEIRLVAFGDWIHSYLSPRQSVDSERSTPSPRCLLVLHRLSSNPFNLDPHPAHSSLFPTSSVEARNREALREF